MAKGKKQLHQALLSPKKYIVTRARTLPIHKCLVNKDWESIGMASIVVMRKHTNGHITAGFYLVDLMALGVKDTHFVFNEPEWKVLEEIPGYDLEDYFMEVPYALVHNIIHGAVAFAEEYDMKPHEDFTITRHILEEDTDDIELMEINFGMDGKPVFAFDDDETESLFDFEEFTDDDWREFLDSSPEVSDEETLLIMEVLFRRWLDKHQPADMDKKPEDLLKNINVTDEPMDVSPVEDEKEHKELEEIYNALNFPFTGNLPSIERRIHKAINNNPNNPMWYNYLATCAQIEGNDEKYKKICESVVHRFPDYFFGKILWINLLMDEQRTNEVPALLNNHFHINKLYTSRNIFHISEMTSFYGTMIRYFTKTGNLRRAQDYADAILDLIENYKSENGSNVLEESLNEFTKVKGIKIIEYLKELDMPTPGFMKVVRQ